MSSDCERELAQARERIGALQAAVAEAERRLRSIVNSVPGAVYQVRIAPGQPPRFEFVGERVLELRGVDAATALRDAQAVWDTVVEEDRAALDAAAAAAAREQKPLRHDFRVRMPDGSVRWLRTVATNRRDPDGSIVRIGYWDDVTAEKTFEMDLRQSQQELQTAKQAADDASRAKSAFLATMSHEIRTPLTGVLGMLELLRRTRLGPEQRAMLDVVDESGQSLQRIIDDILDFSKIEAGRLDFMPAPSDVRQLVERVVALHQGAASRKGLALEYAVDPRLHPALMVDGQRLRQVLGNVVSNAVKFTRRGRVDVTVERTGQQPAADVVCFRVRDTGIGIAPEHQARLFEPFVQAPGNGERARSGTGLGLAISQRLARLMGGALELHSEPGVGTTLSLTLTLPHAGDADADASVARAPSVPLARVAPTIAHAEANGCLVLVVDDHPTNCLVLKGQIRALGYAAVTAQNGAEALELIESRRFGLVLADCNMPVMDGYTLARAVRERERTLGLSRLPVVACTANALQGEAEACREAGMDDYIPKPATLAQLQEKLERFLPREPEP